MVRTGQHGEVHRAGIPNLAGWEATSITERGNPYVIRRSFSQANAMRRVARYIGQDLKGRSAAVVFVNNDFGKGGRDAIVDDVEKRSVNIMADIPMDPGQIDFSAPVLRVMQSNADVLFA